MNQTAEPIPQGPNDRKSSITSRIIRRLVLFPFIAMLGLFFLSMTSTKPTNLGVVDGRLAKCPESPNCVSTQSTDPGKTMQAISFTGNAEETLDKIKASIESNCVRVKLCTESNNYLHYEFTSLLLRFVDDVEFFADDDNNLVHFRSASRIGHSDLGVNKKRMMKICESLNQ